MILDFSHENLLPSMAEIIRATSDNCSTMRVRLRRLTTTLLVVLYGAVGLAGEALHYLVDDVSLAVREIDLSSPGGYFHSHQPDNHLHFHHHHHGEASVTQESQSSDQNKPGSLRQNEQLHHLHACPLLTVVSQLKLGHSTCTPVKVDVNDAVAFRYDHLVNLPFEPAIYIHARGPPLGIA